MRTRLALAVAALLPLSACLDPIVGTQCALGYSLCGGECVRIGSCVAPDAGEEADAAGSDDGENAEAPAIDSDAGWDDGGSACAEEESVCGQQCTNTAADPDNCGGCGVPCASGLCSNSQCEVAGTGRVIVIGHDYLKNRPAMNRILGNAVFLWPTNPVRLLAYQGAANPIAIAGADAAIDQVTLDTGRQVERTDAAAADVATLLGATDVLLIYGQEQASDATLTQLGQEWAGAISTFVTLGGTIIVLDAFYPANAGTVQILSQAGLFDVQRNASTTDSVCTVAARGDALASGLPKTYRCEQNSVSFTTTEIGAAVTSVVESGTSVVIDKVF
jgi:hypothetical protein